MVAGYSSGVDPGVPHRIAHHHIVAAAADPVGPVHKQVVFLVQPGADIEQADIVAVDGEQNRMADRRPQEDTDPVPGSVPAEGLMAGAVPCHLHP